MLVMVDDGGRVVDEDEDVDEEMMLSDELGDEELVDTDDDRSTIG